MNRKLLGYARLARPANLPTAAADILAGVAVAGAITDRGDTMVLNSTSDRIRFSSDGLQIKDAIGDFPSDSIPFADIGCLVLASVCLYAGGVILNDVFDYRLDKLERPERPIPSGAVSLSSAAVYGSVLLLIGTAMAFLVHPLSGWIAVALAAAILLYDAVAKKNGFFGPLCMGVCRGLNLVLGLSVFGEIQLAYLAVIPIVYIFAITLISRGEVHGKNKNHIVLAGVLYASVIFAVGIIGFRHTDYPWIPLLFLTGFALAVFRPLLKAYSENSPRNIKGAVMAGVLSLIALDASLSVVFSVWWYGLLILLLLPVSLLLSKVFAVT